MLSHVHIPHWQESHVIVQGISGAASGWLYMDNTQGQQSRAHTFQGPANIVIVVSILFNP